MTADHAVRPIIVPRDVSILPWSAGYAETINAGKSRHNEDQAMARQGSIGVVVGGRLVNVPYTMFAVFDGHAGAGCAVTASNDLWQAIQVKPNSYMLIQPHVLQARLESVGPQLISARQAGQPDPAFGGEGDRHRARLAAALERVHLQGGLL